MVCAYVRGTASSGRLYPLRFERDRRLRASREPPAPRPVTRSARASVRATTEGEFLRMHEPFSLLLSVYDGDRPDYIRRAFRSAVDDQTVPPDQVVIVQDGPVRDELAQCLDELQARSPVPVTLVALRHNSGLGPALDR